jgi:predicted DNA repair protein MutK
MRKAIGGLGIAILISVLVAGFFAYIVQIHDVQTNITRDGLGRQLSASPLAMLWIFG